MPILATREKDNQRRTVVFLACRYFLRFFPDYLFGEEVIQMETETIGSRIRATRKEMGYSQEELAALLYYEENHYMQIREGSA